MKNLLLIIFVLVTTVAFADDNAALIEKGNKTYTGKFYQQAIDCYLKVNKDGYEASGLYYNLGNAYYKMNDYASAILYFEKAKRLSPGDDDIDFNLKVANTKIVDKIEAIPEFFFIRWYKNVANLFSFNTWAVSGIIVLFIALGLLALFLFARILRIRKIAFWTSCFAFVATVLLFIFAQSQYSSISNTKEAIIFSPSVTAKSSPDANSIELFVIHEGTKVKVTDDLGEWSEIKINNGSKGWVNTAVFKVI